MKLVSAVSMTIATALVMLVVPVAAEAAPRQADRGVLQTRLDRVVAAGGVGAVAEVRDEHRVWRGVSGTAELGTTRPVPADGRFRAGSITKAFVATVVLQLVAERRLRLDDPVATWLPGVIPGGRRITVRELLNHTSGVNDYLDTLPFPPAPAFFANRWRIWTAAELVRRALAEPPGPTRPGHEFAYSNTNYILLGMIIEKITGESYGAEVERRIIRPLHLRGTEMPGHSPRIPGPHLHGYVPADDHGHLRDYTAMNPSVMGAGGELISTTHDLNRFFAALLGGRLLPQHLLHEMTTLGPDGRYGLGLFLQETACKIPLYGHDGDALAYQAWSYSTLDGQRQVSIALTPNFRGDPDRAVQAFLDEAVCGAHS